MFEKLKRLIKGDPKPEKGDGLPEISWVPPESNEWRVPILDLRPVTHQMLSTTKNEECASNALSYGQEDGSGFANQVPESSRTVLAYYGDTWAGVMCPTDEVIAHLLMVRGSEEKLWTNANQHPIDRPAAGLIKPVEFVEKERPDNRSGPFTHAHLRTKCAKT